ncbi:hypothetical protein H2198_005092 [Neophaeococcomyces mojaviensis]|uniref:Uncharacterized protein n=1 Tax=Neophaeococcomyces mojaviensis TaxID=3383035 RepID=A0ACC3A6Q0_9EURO|nr:hypothetical protein H2198_005092 [Knufia sp. JES_112]
MARVSPFTKTVVASMRHLYPEVLADKSFDNTGLLLESPIQAHLPRRSNSVLLTIDLTKAVADEAIEENVTVVVAYHPIIFRGLKSITLDDSQQQTLLRLASHGISVYSPHTAVDIVPGGMADWLCDIVTGKIEPEPEPEAFTAENDGQAVEQQEQEQEQEQEQQAPAQSEPASETDVTTSEDDEPKTPNTNASADPFVNNDDAKTPKPTKQRPSNFHRTYSKPSYPSHIRDQKQKSSQKEESSEQTMAPIQTSATTSFHPHTVAHTKKVITPSPSSAVDAANSSSSSSENLYSSSNTGAGRHLTFSTPQPLSTLITRIAHATGTPKGFPVAIPQNKMIEDIHIRTVGICPGSGSSVIRGCQEPPDLVFTGELSHHEALAVIERGGCVVSLFHSNSERGYLDGVMRQKLQTEIEERWKNTTKEDTSDDDNNETTKEILEDKEVEVLVSRRDRDPFGIVVLQESRVEGEVVG